VAVHNSNTIIKFADDTAMVGLITDDNEAAYREEFRGLAVWCQDKNLSLNMSKTTRKGVPSTHQWGCSEAGLEFHVHTHPHSCEEGTTEPLPPQEAEEI
jgi:hypothetical protein